MSGPWFRPVDPRSLPPVKRPMRQKPIDELLNFMPFQALKHLGYLDKNELGLDPDVLIALRRFIDRFVFDHSGVFIRKPNKYTKRSLAGC
jgi:hypothetical protein